MKEPDCTCTPDVVDYVVIHQNNCARCLYWSRPATFSPDDLGRLKINTEEPVANRWFVSLLNAINEKAVRLIDRVRYLVWERYQNGNEKLLQMHEAVDDAKDCLDSVRRAIVDGDIAEAKRLLDMSIERLDEHEQTLRGLL